MTAPTTGAADAPGLANLQGLLHVYKQSLASVGRGAVEQLRHTLAPSEEDDLHDEDTGEDSMHCPQHVCRTMAPHPLPPSAYAPVLSACAALPTPSPLLVPSSSQPQFAKELVKLPCSQRKHGRLRTTVQPSNLHVAVTH